MAGPHLTFGGPLPPTPRYLLVRSVAVTSPFGQPSARAIAALDAADGKMDGTYFGAPILGATPSTMALPSTMAMTGPMTGPSAAAIAALDAMDGVMDGKYFGAEILSTPGAAWHCRRQGNF